MLLPLLLLVACARAISGKAASRRRAAAARAHRRPRHTHTYLALHQLLDLRVQLLDGLRVQGRDGRPSSFRHGRLFAARAWVSVDALAPLSLSSLYAGARGGAPGATQRGASGPLPTKRVFWVAEEPVPLFLSVARAGAERRRRKRAARCLVDRRTKEGAVLCLVRLRLAWVEERRSWAFSLCW